MSVEAQRSYNCDTFQANALLIKMRTVTILGMTTTLSTSGSVRSDIVMAQS
jgi:hypothetical protein